MASSPATGAPTAMTPTRRQVLLGLGGLAALAPLARYALLGGPRASNTCYISARSDAAGQRFHATGFGQDGTIHFDVPLPARGHAIAVRPGRPEAVLVARRPGRFLLVMNSATGEVLHHAASRPDRHFHGHGVFSPDGRWLFTSENDYDGRLGVIGVRDAEAGYRQVGEFPSHGIGPHDLHVLSDGATLVVANGGIRTHPATGREKLNLGSMSPSLAYLDARSGRLLEEHRLPSRWRQSSIRHLAVTARDRVCLVMQHQGPANAQAPLVAFHRRGEGLKPALAPIGIQKRLRGYCGSACADSSGEVFAVSSPHGDLVTFWNAGSGDYVGHTDIPNGCGVAAGSQAGGFLLSSGEGQMVRYRVGTDSRRAVQVVPGPGARWDNHLSRLTT